MFQILCNKDFLVEWKALLESFEVILTCVPCLATTMFGIVRELKSYYYTALKNRNVLTINYLLLINLTVVRCSTVLNMSHEEILPSYCNITLF